MTGTWSSQRRIRAKRVVFACVTTVAMIVAGLASISVVGETAEARGPAYPGPQTVAGGPAFFGPAPNPFPYCDSPTYFDPFPENINPIGRMDVGSTASVTTDSITMDLAITSEGNPGTQYPGFFPEGGDGSASDQAKGIELAEGDGASVRLTEPLFYSQWIFTDVDQPNEGFTVTPVWTQVGQAAAFGGDNNFTFAGTTNQAVVLDDTNGQSEDSEAIGGRVQVDFLGAVTGIDMLRTFPSNGQSGFAVGGGCEAAGAAKVVVDGPTWNGTSYDVTYELRMRNNLPSSATIQSVINDAVAAVGASLVTGTPQGIDLDNLQLTDDLSDPAFSSIVVTSLSTAGGLDLNEDFNGIDDLELIDGGAVAAESDELITLSVQYTPDLTQANWDDCNVGYEYLNQTEVTGTAAGVPIADLSDNGVNAAPSNNNGDGGVDDPTPVNFDCPPGDLEIVKTVLPGADATCPVFDLGEPGNGDALGVTVDDFVTYCITVRNPGPGPITNVSVTDPQGLGTVDLNDLDAGEEDTATFNVQVDENTATLNTASATATDSTGQLDPVEDTALIRVDPKDQPLLEIVKSVRVGPNATCPSFDQADPGLGAALGVDDGDVVTYCISVRNVGPGDATNVVITDPQAPQAFAIGEILSGEGETVSYDLTVDLQTEEVNVATADYNGPDGPRDPVDDNAQIDVAPLQPELEIVKSVRAGADAACPSFDDGDAGLGDALAVDDGGTVTYCVTVRNSGRGIALDVEIEDTQAPAPGIFDIGTLQPDEERTVTYNVTVDVDVTPTVNTATASGNGPDGPLAEPTDQAQIIVDRLPDPNLEIVKTALVGPGATCPDFAGGVDGLGPALQLIETQVVTYCITVRNIGPGPATQVTVTDDQAPGPFDLGDLAVDEEKTVSYDITTVIADPANVPEVTVNVASASGQGLNGPVGPVTDDAQVAVSLQADPILEIVKTVVPGPNGVCPINFAGGTVGDGDPLTVNFGSTVTYCVAVRNIGGNEATSVTVVDDQVAGSLQLGTIPVGEERLESYDIDVDENTGLRNTATVSGLGPNGPVGPVSDTAVITPAAATLEIVKTVVAGPAGTCPTDFAGGTPGDGQALVVSYGDTVTYCVAVRNLGGNDATNVTLVDDQAPQAAQDLGTVAAGQERLVSYDVVVDENTGLTNTATVAGFGPGGSPIGPVSDTALITPAPAALEIVKSVVVGPNGQCPNFDGGDVGEGDALSVFYNDVVTYCISVKNTGGNPATGVVIGDPQAPASFDGNIGVLPAGEERTRSFDLTVRAQTPERNVATVTGVGPEGVTIPPASDPANIESDPQLQPVLEIVKTVLLGADATCPSFDDGDDGLGTPLDVDLDGTVTYCISIRNSGAGVAENVVISDEQAPDGAGSPWDVGTLGPNQGTTVQFNLDIGLNTPLRNTAAVTGTGPDNTPLQETDPSIVNLIDTRSAVISLIHSVSKASEDCITEAKNLNSLVADFETLDIEWCVTVTNDGNVPLTDLVLVAPRIGVVDGIDPLEGTGTDVLLPGQSATVGFAGVIPETGLVSAASVRATPSDADGNPVGLPEVRDDDTAEVREAQITLETTVVAGADGDCAEAVDLIRVLPGEPITWCYEVTNTGSIDIFVTEVTDETLGITALIPADQQRIGPNTSVIVSANDIATGPLVNDAMVFGRPLDFDGTDLVQAPDLVAEDPAEVEILQADISITKAVSNAGPVAVGAQVTYTLVVSNAGPDAAMDVRVTDELPTGIDYVTVPDEAGWTCAIDADERGFSCLKSDSLANGVSETLSYIGVTNSAAVAGVDLTNTAVVTSTTPDPDDTDNTDTSTTEVDDPPPPPPPPPGNPPLEYPGPFTLPEPPAPPDEVLGLAITGASSNLLSMLAAAMLVTGGLFTVGARRKRDEE